jgi:hypothetical protein
MADVSLPYVAAAALAALLAGAHSYLGERYIMVRLLRRDDLPKLFGGVDFTKRTLRFAWHLTSIAWVGFAAVILLILQGPGAGAQGQLRAIIAATFAASGVVAVVGSRGRHLSWVVFFAIAALVWFGRG